MPSQYGDLVEGLGTAGTPVGGVVTVQSPYTGQQPMANSLPVTIASNQSPVSTTPYSPGPFQISNKTNFGPATDYPGVQTNSLGFKGIQVSLHLITANAGATVRANIVGISLDLGVEFTTMVNLLQSPVLSANNSYADIIMYPGIVEQANITRNLVLPYYWRVDTSVSVGNATFITYCTLLP